MPTYYPWPGGFFHRGFPLLSQSLAAAIRHTTSKDYSTRVQSIRRWVEWSLTGLGHTAQVGSHVVACPLFAHWALSTKMCAYDVAYAPEGPFLTGQWSFFVPTRYVERAMSWAMHHRGDLDVMVHPNTGCEVEDHVTWPLVSSRAILSTIHPR